jgi:hydroxyacylglutathione hydrolase
MKKNVALGLLLPALLLSMHAWSEPVPGSLDVQWSEGAEDCENAKIAPIQVHQYEPQSFILRQSFCWDFEAPLLYLLIGDDEALLVDSGATEDSAQMPLVKTVMDLLPSKGEAKIPWRPPRRRRAVQGGSRSHRRAAGSRRLAHDAQPAAMA